MLAASLALVFIAYEGRITRLSALILLGGFLAYLVVTFITEWRHVAQTSAMEARARCRSGDRAPGLNFFFIVVGAIILFVGARCLINGALAVGALYNLPQPVIGLTGVALATAVPELVITLMAFTRRYTDAAVSHVIAANIFNLLVVLGVVGLIHPLAIAPMIAHADIYVMAGAAALLMPLMIMSWGLSRLNGLFLLLCYGGYLAIPRIPAGLSGSTASGLSVYTDAMESFALHERLAADTTPIADWGLSRVLLMNDARFPWLILVPRRAGLVELHDLKHAERLVLIEEIYRALRHRPQGAHRCREDQHGRAGQPGAATSCPHRRAQPGRSRLAGTGVGPQRGGGV